MPRQFHVSVHNQGMTLFPSSGGSFYNDIENNEFEPIYCLVPGEGSPLPGQRRAQMYRTELLPKFAVIMVPCSL